MKNLLTFWLCLLAFPLLSQIEIYVSDAGNFDNPPWQILKFDANGENPEAFITNNLNWPQDILFLEDKNEVLISNLGSNTITRHNASTGAYLGNFATNISGPTRIKIGPDSLLYVLQWSGNGKVLRYNLDGTLVDEFTDISVNQSIGLDWDTAGNLYVSSYSGDHVRKFNSDGENQGLFVDSDLAGPTNIWFDDQGDLLVADYNGTAVKRFDAAGDFQGNFITGLGKSEGVAFFNNGDILIGNGNTQSVKRFNSAGNYLEEFIESGAGNLLNPNAVVIRGQLSTGLGLPPEPTPSFLYPTIGKEFRIKEAAQSAVHYVEVFDQQGKRVLKRPLQGDMVWNASQASEGLYVIVLNFVDGSSYPARVFVSRE